MAKRVKKNSSKKDAYGFKKIATKGIDAQSRDFMKTVKTGKMGWTGWNKI